MTDDKKLKLLVADFNCSCAAHLLLSFKGNLKPCKIFNHIMCKYIIELINDVVSLALKVILSFYCRL